VEHGRATPKLRRAETPAVGKCFFFGAAPAFKEREVRSEREEKHRKPKK
jgi:hypothetical protein